MVHCVFWLFSGGAPASQLASQGGGRGGVSKASQPPRRSSLVLGVPLDTEHAWMIFCFVLAFYTIIADALCTIF